MFLIPTIVAVLCVRKSPVEPALRAPQDHKKLILFSSFLQYYLMLGISPGGEFQTLFRTHKTATVYIVQGHDIGQIYR